MLETIAKDLPGKETPVPAGHEILRQGERMGLLFVLVSGKVEVIKNGSQICVVEEQGAVFGELSILLGCYQNATVRALVPSTFRVVEGAEQYLKDNPAVSYELACMLARRLALLDSHFAALKKQVNEMQADAAGLVMK